MLSRIFLMAMLIFAISGCSYTPITDPDSPDYLPPIGSTFVLQRAIQLAPGQHVTYIQNGAATTSDRFDRYQPHCQIWIRQTEQSNTSIEPGRFTITDVYNDWTRYGALTQPIMVAGYDAGNHKPFAFYSDEMIDRYVTMKLTSEQQPWIWRLICSSGWDEVWRADDPSINQMRGALNGIAEIRLAE